MPKKEPPKRPFKPTPKPNVGKGANVIVPPSIAAGVKSEVFEVESIVSQPGLVQENGTIVSDPATTVLLRGVSTGKRIAVDSMQLEQLGLVVASRGE